MAISHAHLILLLSLLFFLPTLRATAIPFENCGGKLDPVTVTSVEILEYKNQTIVKISGSTSQTLRRDGKMKVVFKIGRVTISIKTLALCAHTRQYCPVVPGAFVLYLDKISPFGAEWKYNIRIRAFDSEKPILMCITFTVPKLNVTLRSFPNQVAG